MDLATALMFLHFGLLVLFIVLSHKSDKKIYNIFAIGVIISLVISYLKTSVPLIIVCVGLVFWLIFDIVRAGGNN